MEDNPTFVKNGDACMVDIVPTKPMVVEPFRKYPSLGRFVVRDAGRIVAVGLVKCVKKEGQGRKEKKVNK